MATKAKRKAGKKAVTKRHVTTAAKKKRAANRKKRQTKKGTGYMNKVVPMEESPVSRKVSDKAYKGHRVGTHVAIAHRIFDLMYGKGKYRQSDVVKAMSAHADISRNSAGVLYNRFRKERASE